MSHSCHNELGAYIFAPGSCLAGDIDLGRNFDRIVALDLSNVNLLIVKDPGIGFISAPHKLDVTLFSYAMP